MKKIAFLTMIFSLFVLEQLQANTVTFKVHPDVRCGYQANFYRDGEFPAYTAAVGFSGSGLFPYPFGTTITIVAVQVWGPVGSGVVVGLVPPFVTSGSQPAIQTPCYATGFNVMAFPTGSGDMDVYILP